MATIATAEGLTFEKVFGFGRPDPDDHMEQDAVGARLRELAEAYRDADRALIEKVPGPPSPPADGEQERVLNGLQEKRRDAFLLFSGARRLAEDAGYILPDLRGIHHHLK